jgi:hypothetical protein
MGTDDDFKWGSDHDDKWVALVGPVVGFIQGELPEGSPLEVRARQVLCRMLEICRERNRPVDPYILDALIEAFDPDPPATSKHVPKLVFRRRTKGNTAKVKQSWHIALDIYEALQNGQTVAQAQAAAMTEYGIEERQVKKIWAVYGSQIKALKPLERKG